MRDLSDYELMLLVKAKNQDALSILYDRHASLIYSFAFRSFKEESDARDVVQAVFLRLWTTTSEYDREKGKFTTWLLSITRNITIDIIRKKRSVESKVVSLKSEQLANIPDRVTLSPEDSLLRDSLMVQIQKKYKHLSDQQIVLLKHFYWEGYTLKELSSKYDQPLGTIKNRLHQTLKVLRRHLMIEGEDR